MNTFVHAHTGNIFVLTDKGEKDSRIRAKYTPGSKQYQEKYQRHAPASWLQNDFIEEVNRRKYYGNES